MNNVYVYIISIIVLLFSFYSFYHAFTYKSLHRKKIRLILSIWSSIIMLAFAIDHLIEVYNYGFTTEFSLIDSLQFFLTGIALIYMVQNILMLSDYLPSKNRLYGKEHIEDIKRTTDKLIKRYSREQVNISDSFICLIYATAIYLANFYFNLIPRNTAVWFVFWSFPIFVNIKMILFKK